MREQVMEMWLWAAVGILTTVIIALTMKIYILRKSAKEIEDAFKEKLATDTNTLIDISSRDKNMRSLANSINVQLRELRAQRHRFRQGDAELKNAVTNISHDLRTPLTAIYGYLDLIGREETSEEVGRYVDIIRNRAEIMKSLTEELFRYSVVIANEGTLEKEPVDIKGVLEESIGAFYGVFNEYKIVPEIHLPEKRVFRDLNRPAVSRIFSNLISNGIKYSDGDLKITLTEGAKVVFSNRAAGLGNVEVARLFDRFYTVETGKKSTGLGLAISRSLVEQMDGEITADYEDGRLSICISF